MGYVEFIEIWKFANTKEEESDLILDSKTLSADSKLFIFSLLAGSKNFLSFSDRRESNLVKRFCAMENFLQVGEIQIKWGDAVLF